MLTTDYNAEMIGHVEGHPALRDRAIFVGNPHDIVPLGFGPDLPHMRDWVPKHFDFSGYVIGEHPRPFGPREELRQRLGYGADEIALHCRRRRIGRRDHRSSDASLRPIRLRSAASPTWP